MVGARKKERKEKDFEPYVATSWASCDESQNKSPWGRKMEIEIKPNSDKKAPRHE
jgi:hypothetical protein